MIEDLVSKEFAPETTYLNSASLGLPPARTVEALRAGIDAWAAGRASGPAYDETVADVRETFARLVGADVTRVAIGSVVSVQVGLVAAALPPGAEVVVADGEFASVVQPFAERPDLRLRTVPLERVADEIRPGTALVAVSAVQSADGRVADLPAIRAAAHEHGARTLLDGTQAVGWFPVAAGDWDYLVCSSHKWLMCPRGVSFLVTAPEAAEQLRALNAGWYAGEDPWQSCYGTIGLAASARRFDTAPVWPAFVGARTSLRLVEEIGVTAAGAHDTALARRFREGLAGLGRTTPDPGHEGGSAIVSVPGLGHASPALAAAGVEVSSRAGGLRVSFHLHNTEADVDRVLDVLAGI